MVNRWCSLLLLLVFVDTLPSPVSAAYAVCNSYTTTRRCGFLRLKKCTDFHCYTSGEFKCTCPGSRALVSFPITCHRQNGQCLQLSGDRDCTRYANCAVCIPNGCSRCQRGYRVNALNRCTDINECLLPGTCEHRCINTPGSYRCLCNKGYSLLADRQSCKPLSEETLKDNNPIDANSIDVGAEPTEIKHVGRLGMSGYNPELDQIDVEEPIKINEINSPMEEPNNSPNVNAGSGLLNAI